MKYAEFQHIQVRLSEVLELIDERADTLTVSLIKAQLDMPDIALRQRLGQIQGIKKILIHLVNTYGAQERVGGPRSLGGDYK